MLSGTCFLKREGNMNFLKMITNLFNSEKVYSEASRKIKCLNCGTTIVITNFEKNYSLCEQCIHRGEEHKERSKLEKKSKNEENQKFNELMGKLIQAVNEANHWAYNAGTYPTFDEYPQYQEIRELGKQIHKISGIEGMQNACEILKTSCKHPDPYCPSHSAAEYSWKGIDGWMP